MTADDVQKDRLASRLRTAREMAGLSQGQVAKILGLHRPSVSEMEAGRRKVSAAEITRLAEIYKVGIDWLTGSADPGAEMDDRVELAAREFSKLKPKDLDRLMELLRALRGSGGKQP